MKKGLVLGRFQPFHFGHLELIKDIGSHSFTIELHSEVSVSGTVEVVSEES